MARITHFEIPTQDPQAASQFYTQVFGWQINKWEGPVDYYLVSTGENGSPGINGALYTPEDGMTGVINTVTVEDLDAIVEKVLANGGEVAFPRMGVPGIGWLAYIRDLDGNLVGMMQNDPNAM